MGITKQHLQVLIDAENKSGGAFASLSSDANKSLGSGRGGLSALATGAKVAMGAAVAGVAALGAGIVASISTAAAFQQSMAGVQATLGPNGTAGAMEKLTTQAKEMGSTTAFSASEAADGMKFLAQAGFDTDEIMSALPDTLALASAGGLELGEAADIASNVLSGMRLETDDLAGVVDGLAAAASNSNTDVSQMGSAFAQVAPGAAAAGVSFEETAAALGVLADNGIQAGAGGTALDAALRTMIKPTKEAEEAAKKLGLTFTDATGNVRPMVDIVADLEEKNVSAKDALVLFGEEGGRAINALVGSGSMRLQSLQTTIENSGGAAQHMADVQMNTFEGAMKTLGSATEGLMITVGERFLPILQSLINDNVVPAIDAFGDFIDKVGGLGQMFDDAVDLVVGFGQSFITLIDTMFSDTTFRDKFVENLGKMFTTGLDMVVQYWKDFGSLVVSVAELLWEPLSFAFDLIWEPIRDVAVEGINVAGTAIADGVNAIIDKINTVAGALGFELERVDFTPITVDAPRSIEDRYEEMKVNVAAKWEKVGDAATTMAGNLTAGTEALGASTEQVFAQMETVVDDRTKAIAKKYTDNVAVVVKEAEKTGKESGKAIVDSTSAELQTQASKDRLARRGEKLGGWFGAGVVRSVTDKTKDLGSLLRVPDMASGIGDLFDGAGGNFGFPVGFRKPYTAPRFRLPPVVSSIDRPSLRYLEIRDKVRGIGPYVPKEHALGELRLVLALHTESSKADVVDVLLALLEAYALPRGAAPGKSDAVGPLDFLPRKPLYSRVRTGDDAFMEVVGAAVGQVREDRIVVDEILNRQDGQVVSPGRQDLTFEGLLLLLDSAGCVFLVVEVIEDNEVGPLLFDLGAAYGLVETDAVEGKAGGGAHTFYSPALGLAILAHQPLRHPWVALSHSTGFEHAGDVLNVVISLGLGAADVEAVASYPFAAKIDGRRLRVGRLSEKAGPDAHERIRAFGRVNARHPLPQLLVVVRKLDQAVPVGEVGREQLHQPLRPLYPVVAAHVGRQQVGINPARLLRSQRRGPREVERTYPQGPRVGPQDPLLIGRPARPCFGSAAIVREG